MSAEYWEPWTPHLGQAVLTKNRPECFYCREGNEKDAGLSGVIIDVESMADDDDGEPGSGAHRFWVQFDDAAPGGLDMSHFAAIELEPLGGAS